MDDPRTSLAHREIILNKPFLKRVYEDWYKAMFVYLPQGKGKVLEIGSGGGFIKDLYPEVISSDIQDLPNVDMVFSAEKMPFAGEALSAILMLNVFHHIPNPHLFLKEAERCLRPGGRVIMTEPANSTLGRFIYKRFHHEPFDEKGPRQIEAGKPLSHSNQALPYIYFERDLDVFKIEYPRLRILQVKYHSPFRYLLSGGVSRSPLLPYFLYPLVQFKEWILSPFCKQLGLFCTVVVERV
ncbi:MAG TPA: class I SAM-dependent methyltransferase [Bacteroidia bacterium]|nr:class I SAM-dependent methyltransferase [Bacteroidia bacterium]